MKSITVNELSKIIESNNQAKVVDVRTPAEYCSVHIQSTTNIPVENIMDNLDEIKDHDEVYVMCHGGNRSFMVCEDLALHGLKNLVNVEGGIAAWTQKRLPVVRSKKWSMPMMQQVMAIAGTLIITGVLSSLYVHPNFIWLSCGVGIGLLYAGLSGNCYMTKVLAKMPWNK